MDRLETPFVCMYRILSDGDEIFVLTVEHPIMTKAREGFRRTLRRRGLSVRWGQKATSAKSFMVTVKLDDIPEHADPNLEETNDQ